MLTVKLLIFLYTLNTCGINYTQLQIMKLSVRHLMVCIACLYAHTDMYTDIISLSQLSHYTKSTSTKSFVSRTRPTHEIFKLYAFVHFADHVFNQQQPGIDILFKPQFGWLSVSARHGPACLFQERSAKLMILLRQGEHRSFVIIVMIHVTSYSYSLLHGSFLIVFNLLPLYSYYYFIFTYLLQSIGPIDQPITDRPTTFEVV